jgi:hypothetical protein
MKHMREIMLVKGQKLQTSLLFFWCLEANYIFRTHFGRRQLRHFELLRVLDEF